MDKNKSIKALSEILDGEPTDVEVEELNGEKEKLFSVKYKFNGQAYEVRLDENGFADSTPVKIETEEEETEEEQEEEKPEDVKQKAFDGETYMTEMKAMMEEMKAMRDEMKTDKKEKQEDIEGGTESEEDMPDLYNGLVGQLAELMDVEVSQVQSALANIKKAEAEAEEEKTDKKEKSSSESYDEDFLTKYLFLN